MNTEHDGTGADPIPLPRLSDEAAVEIRNFVEYLLDQFDTRYGDQVHRFYESRSRQNMLRPDPQLDDGEPF